MLLLALGVEGVESISSSARLLGLRFEVVVETGESRRGRFNGSESNDTEASVGRLSVAIILVDGDMVEGVWVLPWRFNGEGVASFLAGTEADPLARSAGQKTISLREQTCPPPAQCSLKLSGLPEHFSDFSDVHVRN